MRCINDYCKKDLRNVDPSQKRVSPTCIPKLLAITRYSRVYDPMIVSHNEKANWYKAKTHTKHNYSTWKAASKVTKRPHVKPTPYPKKGHFMRCRAKETPLRGAFGKLRPLGLYVLLVQSWQIVLDQVVMESHGQFEIAKHLGSTPIPASGGE